MATVAEFTLAVFGAVVFTLAVERCGLAVGSHSQGVALYALTRLRAVGIDVEQIRSDVDMDGVAASVFSTDERATAWWNEGPSGAINARRGAALDLHRAGLGPGYAAALAGRGQNLRLVCLQWCGAL